ncbi:RagB/SusD family nutrient uptake outer membrane protein [Halalkalibaculum sp. DA3122]|uniref:RagB/SusD family nutrient uptake outer membrane protein n=1 Tax=Halalkalibaculum sp. DA3122 TaxID=3373607 RepID=UPI00375458B5
MKKTKLLTFIVACLFVAIGCEGEDYLNNVTPSSGEGPGQGEWQSVTDLEHLVVGSYWMTSGECCNETTFTFSSFARTLPTDITVPFSDAGNGYFIGPSEANVFYDLNHNPDNSALNKIWRSAYAVIGNSNDGIQFINENFMNNDGEPPFEDPDNQISRIYGEFKFLRAYNYYMLAKTFSPPYSQDNLSEQSVIIRTEPTAGFGEANKPRGTVEELYDVIVSDLEAAIENLPDAPRSVDPEQYNYSRATKPAAKLLLARVAFEMQNWDLAQQMATEVIEDSRFTLDEDPIVAWEQDIHTRPNEVVWYYQYVDGDGVGHASNWKWPKAWNSWNATRADWGLSGSIVNNSKFIAASYSFLEKVDWIDNVNDRNETTEATNDLRYQQLYKRFEAGDDTGGLEFDRPTVWVNKYYRNPDAPPVTNVPLLRVSEMYLTRAIISFLGGNGANQDVAQARSDINTIRERAGLSPIAQGDLTAEIIHAERMRELSFEGDRLPYLQALRQDIPRGDRSANSPLPWNDGSLVFPVPTGETDFNNAL